MESGFRRLSRVGRLTGGTKWYLSEDCLLAARRTMYSVEYLRFYLCDLESVVVWPSRLWRLRLIPGVLCAFLGAWLWEFVNYTAGAVFVGIGLAWIVFELALGPTANSRIRTTGATVDLPLVKRTRRAEKVIAQIDAALRSARGVIEPQTAPAVGTEPVEASSITTATPTHAS